MPENIVQFRSRETQVEEAKGQLQEVIKQSMLEWLDAARERIESGDTIGFIGLELHPDLDEQTEVILLDHRVPDKTAIGSLQILQHQLMPAVVEGE